MRNEDLYTSIKVSKKNRYWLNQLKLEFHMPSLNNVLEQLIDLGFKEIQRRKKIIFELQMLQTHGE